MYKNDMKIRLSDEQKKRMREILHDFYLDEKDEDIGLIFEEKLIELFMDELAPLVYNKALDDAKAWFTEKMNDADCDYFELYKE